MDRTEARDGGMNRGLFYGPAHPLEGIGRWVIALVFWSAVTPRSIKSPNLECGGRLIPEDLVLDCHKLEAPLASRSILRCRLSSCLDGSDGGKRRVGTIVPAIDRLYDLHVSALDRDLDLLDVFLPSTPLCLICALGSVALSVCCPITNHLSAALALPTAPNRKTDAATTENAFRMWNLFFI